MQRFITRFGMLQHSAYTAVVISVVHWQAPNYDEQLQLPLEHTAANLMKKNIDILLHKVLMFYNKNKHNVLTQCFDIMA